MEDESLRKFLVVLCFSLIFTMVIPVGQATNANTNTTFHDVGVTHRAQAEIYYLVNQGVASGISSTLFAPDREVTRGEAAAMLGRALKIDGKKKATKFSDVPASHAFSGYIHELVERKVISGYKDGTFKPNQTLTRGDMAVLISRAFNFNSSSVSAATSELMNKGISLGMGDGTFGEHQNIKRADFSVFLARSMNVDFRIAESDRFTKTMFVNAGSSASLNMRSGPSTNYNIVGTLATGTAVLVSTTQNSWSNIKVGSQTGFVHSNYLQATKPAPPTPPTTPGKKALKDLIVIIDPGHGGKDPGSLGNGLRESEVVLKIGHKMAKYYDKTPMQAKLTRTGDTFIPLDARASYAQRINADLFVSIHTNSFSNSSANGQETFYPRVAAASTRVNDSKALAIYTQHRMQEAWNLTNRGVKEGNLAVLRDNSVPAVLAEIGFISNAKDAGLMKSEASLDKMAKGLFLATLDYYYYYEGRTDVAPLYAQFGAKPSGKRH